MSEVTHELKTHPAFFRDIVEERKSFEVRKDDRGFKVGDLLILHEWPVPSARCKLNRTYESCWGHDIYSARITYILRGGEFGIETGYVVMGLDNSDAGLIGGE